MLRGALGLFLVISGRDGPVLFWAGSFFRVQNTVAGSSRPGRAPAESLVPVPAQPRACSYFCSKKKISFFNIFFLLI